MSAAFEVEFLRADAAKFHAWNDKGPWKRRVRVQTPTKTALVLGSTQSGALIDQDAVGRLGWDVVKRRSGGGAVLVEPSGLLWVDVTIGRDDPLWHDDVGVASRWLGQAWIGALETCGVSGAELYRGKYDPGPLGGAVCFGGRSHGEVMLGEAKAVGIASRRGAAGAWFQTAALLKWDPTDLLSVLVGPKASAQASIEGLEGRAVGVNVDPVGLAAAFLAGLPAGISVEPPENTTNLCSMGWFGGRPPTP